MKYNIKNYYIWYYDDYARKFAISYLGWYGDAHGDNKNIKTAKVTNFSISSVCSSA